MDKYGSRSRDTSQILRLRRSSDDKIQYLMRAEEQLLQSIPARTPLLEVLDRICSAINSQIGNMVSLISLPGDDVTDHAAIARIAALFGLHAFCSSGVVRRMANCLDLWRCTVACSAAQFSVNFN